MNNRLTKPNQPKPPTLDELGFLAGILMDRQEKNEAAKEELEKMFERQKRELIMASQEQLSLREAILKDITKTKRILYWVHSEGKYLINKGKL